MVLRLTQSTSGHPAHKTLLVSTRSYDWPNPHQVTLHAKLSMFQHGLRTDPIHIRSPCTQTLYVSTWPPTPSTSGHPAHKTLNVSTWSSDSPHPHQVTLHTKLSMYQHGLQTYPIHIRSPCTQNSPCIKMVLGLTPSTSGHPARKTPCINVVFRWSGPTNDQVIHIHNSKWDTSIVFFKVLHKIRNRSLSLKFVLHNLYCVIEVVIKQGFKDLAWTFKAERFLSHKNKKAKTKTKILRP